MDEKQAEFHDVSSGLISGLDRQGDASPYSTNRPAVASGASIFALASLSACGGGEGGSSSSAPPIVGPSPSPSPSPPPTPTPSSSAALSAANKEAARFLLRAGFAASSSAIAAVKDEGMEAWLNRQMHAQNDQTAAEYFKAKGFDEITSSREFLHDRLTDPMIWDQLLRGGNSVRKRAALALSEFFVVSANRLDITWPSQAIGAFWDLLNKHAFGNFRNLLEAVALNPAMAAFLDTLGNRKDDPSTGQVPDENFAREILQLFSIGLYELNPDGSIMRRNGNPIETYSNEDIEGLARVFTGYGLDASGLKSAPDPVRTIDTIFEPEIVRRPLTAIASRWPSPETSNQHSMDEKRFLGMTIPAGTGPVESLHLALNRIFNHRNVAPFFSKQMIQRLVTSNPSPGYIARIASVFDDNGKGVRGDLGAVFKAILLDGEAKSPATVDDYRFGKVREPAIRFIQFGRMFDLAKNSKIGITRDLSDGAELLGQVPLRPPSVFNFFRPSYVKPRSSMHANDMVGPEFQIINEMSVAGYVNFMSRTIEARTYWLNDLVPDYSAYVDLTTNPETLVDQLSLLLSAGQMRPFNRDLIVDAVASLELSAESQETDRIKAIQMTVMLIMASADYLVQK